MSRDPRPRNHSRSTLSPTLIGDTPVQVTKASGRYQVDLLRRGAVPPSMLRSLCAVVSVALVMGLGIGLGTSASAPAQASRISPQDFASGTVNVGANPNQVAVDDSGTYAYVTAVTGQTLDRVRLSDFSVDDSLVFPTATIAVAVHDDTVYVTDLTHFYQVNADTLAPPPPMIPSPIVRGIHLHS